MSNAHEGEADGLRIGGWAPESDSDSSDEEPVTDPSDGLPATEASDPESSGLSDTNPTDESPLKVVTQPLPTVPEGPVRSSVPMAIDADGSIPRAVARRAPAPLPNLGRDESPEDDAPSRKRSRLVPVPTPPVDSAAAAGLPADPAPDSTPEPAMSTGRESAISTGPEPAMSTEEVAESEPRTGAHEPQAEPELESAPTDVAASVTQSLETVMDMAEDLGAPAAATGATGSDGRLPIEGVVLGRSDVAAEVEDQWSEPVAVGATASRSGMAMSARASVPAPEPRRRGPAVLAADSWDLEPEVVDDSRERYHGRRRADAPAARLWLAITLVLVGLGAAIAIPLALMSGPRGAAAPADSPTRVETIAEGPVSPFESLAATVSPTPSPSPSPSTSTRRPVAPPPPPPSPTPSPIPPPFGAVTIEAEAGGDITTPSESTRNVEYPGASGGRIIQNIGAWDRPPGPGTLTFNHVAVPSTGTYTITIFYVHPNNEADRQAIVSVSGTEPVTVDFAGNSACCLTKAVSVIMTAGEHTIMISNPAAHAPAIDKIVISRP